MALEFDRMELDQKVAEAREAVRAFKEHIDQLPIRSQFFNHAALVKRPKRSGGNDGSDEEKQSQGEKQNKAKEFQEPEPDELLGKAVGEPLGSDN